MGIGYAANLGEGESFTTSRLKINYLKPVWNSLLRATARVVKQGQTVGLVECDVTDEKKLVARATSTCMTHEVIKLRDVSRIVILLPQNATKSPRNDSGKTVD